MILQLSVFLQNKSGKIASITQALDEAGVNIRALSIADTSDFGILRMLVDDVQTAKDALIAHNCIVSTNEVTVVALPDEKGSLANLLAIFVKEGIDIEYMYSYLAHDAENAYMVFRVTDGTKLHEILNKNGIVTVSGDTLGLR